jgi:ankyrin repeat protein
MKVVNNCVLHPEWRGPYHGENVASEMKALFWDEETQNDLDLSPLHQALLPGAAPLEESHVRLLTAYLNTGNAAGATPLMWAATRGDTQSLKLLLEHGADPNLRCHSLATALHYAAQYGTEAGVELLLEYGASPFATDCVGVQPLHSAVNSWRYGGDPLGKIEALIQHGADVDAPGPRGMTPIFWLSESKMFYPDNLRIARHLIEAGADIDGGINVVQRPVENALILDNVPLARYLLDIGAEVRLHPLGRSNSILHEAAMWTGTEVWDLLKTLVNQGAFPDLESCLTNSCRYTPWDCFENCRFGYAYSDWKNYDAEREKFGELMEAVDRAILTKPVCLFPPPPRDTPTKTMAGSI